MLGKTEPGKKTLVPDSGNGGRLLHEIEAISKALSLNKKPPSKSLPSDPHRSFSAGKSRYPDPRPKPRAPALKEPPKEKKPSSSSSIWNWKPLKALSHIRNRRFDCRFTLQVHSVEGLPSAFNDLCICVHWKRSTDAGTATSPVRVFQGTAEFEDVLMHRCSVYGSRSGPHHSAKYEARHFLLYASVVGSPGIDLGKHRMDLTRLLPLTLEELEEEESSSGKWSTSFKLSGKGRGASLNVSFGFSVIGNDLAESGGRKGLERADTRIDRTRRGNGQSSLRRVGSVPGLDHASRDHSRLTSRSVDDVKVLHEVLPSSRSEASALVKAGQELLYGNNGDGESGALSVDPKPEFEVFSQQDELLDLKSPVAPQPVKGDEDNECKEPEERECEDPEFTVVDQGVEATTLDHLKDNVAESGEHEGVDKKGEIVMLEQGVSLKPDQVEDLSVCDLSPGANSLLTGEFDINELDSAFCGLSIFESPGLESLQAKEETPTELSYMEVKSNYKGKTSKSLSLDDVAESVASEFLDMLGIEHSPYGLSSESDLDSPKERLWKQFQKDSLSNSDSIFGLDFGMEQQLDFDVSEDLDLYSTTYAAETDHQKATQAMKSKTRAKILEDTETEALMREWGLDDTTFQRSPPGSRSGFGSPIDLPNDEPLDLPPLGEGLGSFVQTKDGGFLRSMNPSLFKNCKNNGSLIMQVSNPVVVPAEMGSGVMDILQNLASVGIEKLSMQANKLMPLEDITGKTMWQITWEAAPALDACESHDFLQQLKPGDEVGHLPNAFGGKKGLKASPSRSTKSGSEYVSLEDLAPLAMDQIEALSVEGLRIQSGMSDEDAPSNICPQNFGEISALEGKGAKNNKSLGLEGAAGLQLLDVKDGGDDVDGLMGLSITLDEWMRLDSGIVDEEDEISDRTSKILAAHHACSADFVRGGWKGDKRGSKNTGRRWGLLGNNFTVALMVQLRDPLRNYEPVGAPMLSLIQVERVFVPPKSRIYTTVSDKGNSEQYEEEETKPKYGLEEEKKEEEDAVPQFRITEVHVAGLESEPGKKKLWGNPKQQQSGSRWLLASGMGKSSKHPFMKSKAVVKPSQVTTKPSQATTTVQPGDTLWSISSRVHGTGAKWKELAALNPHIRNPNVILPDETIRLS